MSDEWYIVDAENKPLGRLATQVAGVLRGKHRPEFSPHLDLRDFVVIINADKIYLSGKKREQKTYWSYSGYPSGLKTITLRDQLKQHPDRVIRLAVRGMLPKNRLGRQMIKKLKVYREPTHPHQAQMPKPLAM